MSPGSGRDPFARRWIAGLDDASRDAPIEITAGERFAVMLPDATGPLEDDHSDRDGATELTASAGGRIESEDASRSIHRAPKCTGRTA